jgi:uncharacterized repeat protein (TIGR03803 family)
MDVKSDMAFFLFHEGTRNPKWFVLVFLSFFAFGANLVQAQTYTVLKSFPALSPFNYTNSEGAEPQSGLILWGGTLYGMTASGGDGGGVYGSGTIFKMNRDGSGFMVLKSFPGLVNGTNVDGTVPVVDLTADGDTLYGATSNGGTNDLGTIFRINTDGTGFQALKQLNYPEAAGVYGKLVLSGGRLFGAAFSGGAFTNGTIFRMNTNGTEFVTLRDFAATTTNESGFLTNTDGANPQASLTLANDGMFYGTTVFGGSAGRGTVFRIKPDGSSFAVLKHFPSLSSTSPRTNCDGASPITCVTLDGNVLYGTAWMGGNYGQGTVFKMNSDGSGYMVLKHFNVNDGAAPFAGLVISGHTLYGTTRSGGNATNGTVFKVNTDGSGYEVLKNFSTSLGLTNNDGTKPEAGLVLDGGALYGTTRYGGNAARGVVFKLELSPPLNFQIAANKLVLTWTNSSFSLQTSADIFGTFTNIQGATSAYTNSLDENQRFFRLISD